MAYKFSFAGCAACYVGEITRHFSTRVREHLETDRASHIFKHLESSKACRSACSLDNFAMINQASSQFALKTKETLHILWEKPALNAQVKHVNLYSTAHFVQIHTEDGPKSIGSLEKRTTDRDAQNVCTVTKGGPYER